MSFFALKTLAISISSINATTLTQVMSTTEADISIFNNESLSPIVSKINYPTITVASSLISLEQGWKYFIEARLKCVTATPLVADSRLRYVITNASDTILSSEGNMTLWRSGSSSVSQEKCCVYIDATASSQQIKLRGNKIDTGSVVTLNAQDGTAGTTFKSYLLIKAWR